MGSSVRRISGVTVSAVVLALGIAGNAVAAEGPDDVIVNDCDATLAGAEEGKPITLDAGALVQAPGVLTVGLGSEASGTNGDEEPLLVLPVADATEATNLNDAQLVKDTTGTVCGTVVDGAAKPAVNTLSATAQSALPGDDLIAPPGDDDGNGDGDGDGDNNGDGEGTPPPEDPDGPGTQPPGSEQPGDQPGSGITPIGFGPGSSGLGGINRGIQFAALNNAFDTLGSLALPPAAVGPPVQAPDLGTPKPGEQPPAPRAQDSGTAQAVPASNEQDRLPLLLAVIALAVAVLALSKTWFARKSG